LLGRLADPGGLASWTALLNNGLPPAQVVFLIETDPGHEYYARLVSSFYQFYLHRPEGPSDGAAPVNMVNLLAGGGAIEQLRTVFTSSPEYFQTRGGGTNPGYVNALYAFGTPNRVATDPGAAAFANALSNGSVTRVQVCNAVFTSDEFRFDLVQSYYVQFLHRSGAAGEINNGWAALLKQGVPDQQTIAGILGSPEAFARGGKVTLYTTATRKVSYGKNRHLHGGEPRIDVSSFFAYLPRVSVGSVPTWDVH
jgi:hypothetical protein